MGTAALTCRIEDRRKQLFNNAQWNGIDFLEVLPGQKSLCVHFFGPVPGGIGIDNVRIEGGRRIRDIRAVKVTTDLVHDEEADDCLHVTLDKFGDFSTYRLCLLEPVIARGGLVALKSDNTTEPGGGQVSISERSVLLEADREISARVYLFPKADLPHKSDLQQGIDLGEAVPIKGPQRFAIPDGVDAKNFPALVIWLESSKSPQNSDVATIIAYEAALVPVGQGADEDEGRFLPLSGLDPRYNCIEFGFKVDCQSDLDCKPAPACPPQILPAPDINYLAKDYASFRQLILDRLALIMPDWQERHVPDLGVTLVELLAYVGDYLSYYQDAVATEAYLDTARRRISVRRHARLVDYRMHEGNNARAWVTVCVANDLSPLKADRFYFVTGFAGIRAADGWVKEEDLRKVPQGAYEVFEPLAEAADHAFKFRKAHNEIHFYTWGDGECCLPKGATRATLLDELPKEKDDSTAAVTFENAVSKSKPAPRFLELKKGDELIFEEIKGPTTNDPADADPTRRHAVRLCKDPVLGTDGVLNRNVLEIEWDVEDALPFSFCVSARLPSPDCGWIDCVSVARGNVVLVDHGRTSHQSFDPVGEKCTFEECGCENSVIEVTRVPERFTATLMDTPLTFAEDYPVPATMHAPQASASRLMVQDPRQARPHLRLAEAVGAPAIEWQARYDLLESGSADRHFVTEIDDVGHANLRFGDGDLGAQPAGGTHFQAIYRIGNGPAGNVGRETIKYLVLRDESGSMGAVAPRNPLPALGGIPPEPIALAKLMAPSAFRTRRERAITAEDYSELAQRSAAVQRAAGELRWMGSWYEPRISIDPAHTEDTDPRLLREIRHGLYRYRRMGHDLATAQAEYVSLDVIVEICVRQHYARGEVLARLLDVFGNGKLADGTLGFFHPDRLTFGQGIYLSQIIAVATAVEGVETARVQRLQRLDGMDEGALSSGVLPLGAFEVPQCDNDPNFPERGKLTLKVRGGR